MPHFQRSRGILKDMNLLHTVCTLSYIFSTIRVCIICLNITQEEFRKLCTKFHKMTNDEEDSKEVRTRQRESNAVARLKLREIFKNSDDDNDNDVEDNESIYCSDEYNC